MSGVRITASIQKMPSLLYPSKVKESITGQTSQMIGRALAQARQTVAAGTPVRTGTARSGWAVQRNGALEGTLWNPVLYVPFLVLGTRYMSASVTLDAAITKATQDIERMAVALGSQIVADLTKDY